MSEMRCYGNQVSNFCNAQDKKCHISATDIWTKYQHSFYYELSNGGMTLALYGQEKLKNDIFH